jgi:hypothetical protein
MDETVRNLGLKITLTFFAMLIVGVIGMFVSDAFFDLHSKLFRKADIDIVITSLDEHLKEIRYFSVALALLPLLFLLSYIILSQEKRWKLIVTVIIIVSSGIEFLFYHSYTMKAEISYYAIPGIKHDISTSSLHIGWNLGVGFVVGMICSVLLYRLDSKLTKL